MAPLRRITWPCYLYRPAQLARRLGVRRAPPGAPAVSLRLPWRLSIRARPGADIGFGIATTGLSDLVLTELLWRLVPPGATVLDVGANIGYTAAVCALRAGPGGRVFALEPHPALFAELAGNVHAWSSQPRLAPITPLPAAAGAAPGEAWLREPARGFDANPGLATLRPLAAAAAAYPVPVVRLDERFADAAPALVKIDVEGFELEVLRGAEALLRPGRVSCVVFEEFQPYPAPTHRLLESFGYTVLHVEAHLLRPRLLPTSSGYRAPANMPANYLATRDAAAARRAFAPRGWRCLV